MVKTGIKTAKTGVRGKYAKNFSKKFIFFALYPWHYFRLFYIWTRQREKTTKQNADVAQLDRAFGYEPKGSRFESWHPQKKRLVARLAFSVFVSTRNWNRREPKATGINRSCWREDEPRFSYRHAGSSGLHTAPGSSPGTRRREDQPKGWSSFFHLRRPEARRAEGPSHILRLRHSEHSEDNLRRRVLQPCLHGYNRAKEVGA